MESNHHSYSKSTKPSSTSICDVLLDYAGLILLPTKNSVDAQAWQSWGVNGNDIYI